MISHAETSRETPDGAALSALLIYAGIAGPDAQGPAQPRVQLEFTDAKRVQVPDPDFVPPENEPDAVAPNVDATNALGRAAYRQTRAGRHWGYTITGAQLQAALVGAARKTAVAVLEAAGLDPADFDLDALAVTLAQQGHPEQALRAQAEEIEVARRSGGFVVQNMQGTAP